MHQRGNHRSTRVDNRPFVQAVLQRCNPVDSLRIRQHRSRPACPHLIRQNSRHVNLLVNRPDLHRNNRHHNLVQLRHCSLQVDHLGNPRERRPFALHRNPVVSPMGYLPANRRKRPVSSRRAVLAEFRHRNPANNLDQWLVAAKYFEDNFEEISDA